MEYNVQLNIDGEDKGYFHVLNLDDWHTLQRIQKKLKTGLVTASVGRYGDDLNLGMLVSNVKSDFDKFLFISRLRSYLMTARLAQDLMEGKTYYCGLSPMLLDDIQQYLKDRKADFHFHEAKCPHCYLVDEALLKL